MTLQCKAGCCKKDYYISILKSRKFRCELTGGVNCAFFFAVKYRNGQRFVAIYRRIGSVQVRRGLPLFQEKVYVSFCSRFIKKVSSVVHTSTVTVKPCVECSGISAVKIATKSLIRAPSRKTLNTSDASV